MLPLPNPRFHLGAAGRHPHAADANATQAPTESSSTPASVWCRPSAPFASALTRVGNLSPSSGATH
eukprot:SAG31_NODE_526_length_14475_cov_5.135197_8_plen_66_part_00